MSGNVWEWCFDWHESYSSAQQNNPTGHASGTYRIFRGGGFNSSMRGCRVSYRGSGMPDYNYFNLGFRLVIPI